MFKVRQARHEETAKYYKRSTAVTEDLEHVGVMFGAMFQGIADDILKKHYRNTRTAATDAQATGTELKSGESVLAITFLMQACPVRYSEVARKLENDFLKGMDHYPANVTAA